MALFGGYKLEQEGDGYVITLFMYPGREEFAEELEPNQGESYNRLETNVRSYVRDKFPGLKIKAAKVMAGAMIIASVPLAGMTAAFAADTAPAIVAQQVPSVETSNKNVQKAVERLGSLGLTVGFEDGKYHEDREVTRAEFATFLVRALGLEDAAKAAIGNTAFKDVPGNHWASGYISVASGQGLIKGVGNDRFDPESKVTYGEAVTMTVRALGYKDEFLRGTWPGNFVAKGNELDLLKNITYASNGRANRGDIAILVNNSLDAKVVKQTSFGDNSRWEETGKTLLQDRLRIEKVDDQVITSVPRTSTALKSNEVRVGNTTYRVAAGIAVNDLLGSRVNIYTRTVNGNNTIIYFDLQTREADIARGTIDNIGGGKIKLLFSNGSDKEYDLADTPNVFIGNEGKTLADLQGLAGTKYARVVLNDNGKVAFIEAYGIEAESIVVRSVDVDKKVITGLKGIQDDSKVRLGEKDGLKIFLNAKEASLADLKAGDVVYTSTVKEGDKDFTYAFVSRNVLEGTLGSLKPGSLKINGKDYDVATAFATYSMTNDTQAPKTYNEAAFGEIGDSIGKTVRAYLDINGKVRHLVADVQETTDTIYGVVTRAYLEQGNQAIRVQTATGEVAYVFNKDITAPAKGDIVSFKLTKEGKINNDNFAIITAAADLDSALLDTDEVTITSFDKDRGFIADSTNERYYISDKTVFMQYYDNGAVGPAVIKWDDIKGRTPAANLRAVIVKDGIDTKFVVFTDNYNLTADAKVGYVTGNPYYDGDWKVDVTLPDGGKATYKVDKDAVKEGDFIVFTADKDNKIAVNRAVYDNFAEAGPLAGGFTVKAGTAELVRNNGIRVAGDTFRNFASNYKVFILDLNDQNQFDNAKGAELGDLEQNHSIVRTIVNNDGDIEMVIIMK